MKKLFLITLFVFLSNVVYAKVQVIIPQEYYSCWDFAKPAVVAYANGIKSNEINSIKAEFSNGGKAVSNCRVQSEETSYGGYKLIIISEKQLPRGEYTCSISISKSNFEAFVRVFDAGDMIHHYDLLFKSETRYGNSHINLDNPWIIFDSPANYRIEIKGDRGLQICNEMNFKNLFEYRIDLDVLSINTVLRWKQPETGIEYEFFNNYYQPYLRYPEIQNINTFVTIERQDSLVRVVLGPYYFDIPDKKDNYENIKNQCWKNAPNKIRNIGPQVFNNIFEGVVLDKSIKSIREDMYLNGTSFNNDDNELKEIMEYMSAELNKNDFDSDYQLMFSISDIDNNRKDLYSVIDSEITFNNDRRFSIGLTIAPAGENSLNPVEISMNLILALKYKYKKYSIDSRQRIIKIPVLITLKD